MSLIDALPRARSPFGEESSSQEESMKVSPSRVEPNLLSLIDDGKISVIEEEEKEEEYENAVTSRAPQALHEEEVGALAPRTS